VGGMVASRAGGQRGAETNGGKFSSVIERGTGMQAKTGYQF